jgi:hypothetical protein
MYTPKQPKYFTRRGAKGPSFSYQIPHIPYDHAMEVRYDLDIALQSTDIAEQIKSRYSHKTQTLSIQCEPQANMKTCNRVLSIVGDIVDELLDAYNSTDSDNEPVAQEVVEVEIEVETQKGEETA